MREFIKYFFVWIMLNLIVLQSTVFSSTSFPITVYLTAYHCECNHEDVHSHGAEILKDLVDHKHESNREILDCHSIQKKTDKHLCHCKKAKKLDQVVHQLTQLQYIYNLFLFPSIQSETSYISEFIVAYLNPFDSPILKPPIS